MNDKLSGWAWYCERLHTYVFFDNPNKNSPPYHLHDIMGIFYGERMVLADRKWVLMEVYPMDEWNKRFPGFRVRPVRVSIGIERIEKTKKSSAK